MIVTAIWRVFASRPTAGVKARSVTDSRRVLAKFILLAVSAPTLWLAYNGIIYRNPLEFENGPYSAKAIERKTQMAGNSAHPGSHNLLLAGIYFVKSAEVNVAENQWLQRVWLLLAAGSLAAAFKFGSRTSEENSIQSSSYAAGKTWPLLFLMLPLPFYALSVAYGGVPIFVPQFWPHTHYNVRYGLQLLPLFAAAVGILVCFAIRRSDWKVRIRTTAVLVVFVIVIAGYASIWRAGPECLQEAQINMRYRNALERQLASWLQKLPSDSTLLMYVGDHVGALQQAGIPLKRAINEGNHRVWKQPRDPNGLWERALADPSRYADFAVAFEGDPVWQVVHDRHLPAIVELHITGQPPAVLYRVR